MKSDKKENKNLQATDEQTTPTTLGTLTKSFFEQHYSMVYRTAYRVTGSADDAEDVLQSVFLRMLQLEKESNIPKNPGGYLYRSAVNRSLDLLRHRKRWPSLSIEDNEFLLNDNISRKEDRSLETTELHDMLRQAILALPPLESKVFIMKYFEELQNKEIAEILETTSNNVNVALHSARTKLKTRLTPYVEIT